MVESYYLKMSLIYIFTLIILMIKPIFGIAIYLISIVEVCGV